MSFLQKSDLKKHLSTRSGNMPHHNEAPPTEGSRVILRDGNLITLPPSILEEEEHQKGDAEAAIDGVSPQ
jgi:hypothetical protein